MFRLPQQTENEHREVKRKLNFCPTRSQNWNTVSDCTEPGAVMPLTSLSVPASSVLISAATS